MTNGNDTVDAIFLQHGLTHDSHVDLGLTKREYFAAMAMQGLLSSDSRDAVDEFVKYSVYAADALIKALNQQ